MTSNRVARSLTDRVLGGVCGGLAAYLGIKPGGLRIGVLLLAVLSQGAVGVLYLILWWVLPLNLTPDTPAPGRDLGRLLLVSVLCLVGGALDWASGVGTINGLAVGAWLWPGLIILAGLALVWQQIQSV
jgi:phage shock protein PspC (stress-responsive transcriptional regulator)